MAKQWKLIHIKSKQHEEDGTAKLPGSDVLEYGEIAINYGKGIETISIKNENDEIVKFVSEKKMQEYVDKKIKETLGDLKEKIPFNIEDTSIDSGEY